MDEVSGIAGTGPIRLRLAVRNRGTADWPVLDNFARVLPPFTVYLEARLTRLSQSTGSEESAIVHDLTLDRDVQAGETIIQRVSLPRPAGAGRYRLDISVVQKDGPQLVEPPSQMLHQVFELTTEAVEEETADESGARVF